MKRRRIVTSTFVLAVVAMAVCRRASAADFGGAWRVSFLDAPGGMVGDTCRFTATQTASGQIEGKLTGCGLGTDGVFAGTLDSATGALLLWIVAPHDPGCETYSMDGTLDAGGDLATGTFACTSPTSLTGYFEAVPCDPAIAGSCPGTAPVHEVRACRPAEPTTGCDGPATGRGKISLRRLDAFHYQIAFKLPKTLATTAADFGDPLGLRDYVACVYDTDGAEPRLVAMEPAFAGTVCDGLPCWSATPAGFRYRNSRAPTRELASIQLKAGTTGASIKLKGATKTVLAPPPGTPLGLPVTFQLVAGDACWSATFTDARRNDGTKFKK